MPVKVRTLYFHVDEFHYRAIKPAIKNPPDPPSEASFGEALVAFITVEMGDGEDVIKMAVEDLVSHADRLKVERIVLYPYAHLSSNLEKPSKAHKALARLETVLRTSYQGEVHRAPFGWYKSFRLVCKGHPLAELSRTFTNQPREEPWPSLKELMSGSTGELMARIGLLDGGGLPPTWAYTVYMDLAHALLEISGYKTPESIGWHETLVSAYQACSEASGPSIYVGPGAGNIVIGPINDAEEAYKAVFKLISNMLEGEPSYDIDANGLIKARADGSIIGFRRESRVCIGPLSSIARLALSQLIKIAKEGITPYLNFGFTPIQVTIIPVGGEELDYATSLARRAASLGSRVWILEGEGLGRRIREAGRRWSAYTLVVGKREVETRTITVRRRWEAGRQEVVTEDEFFDELSRMLGSRPGLVHYSRL
ncbi:MAG: hypothetical protein F7B20_00250 [Aeropyrum sp.]|nr:hypothetical protein [Aeropyrum sp.]